MRQPPTNITPVHREAFDALTSGQHDNFALFSCYVDGQPASAIVAVNRDADDYVITPLFVSVTDRMVLTDHDGIQPATQQAEQPVTPTGKSADTHEALRARVEQIITTLCEEELTPEKLAQALYQEEGYEPFPWHRDDIRCVWAEVHGKTVEECPLSDDACMGILDRLRRKEDPAIGINREVIAHYLDGVTL